MISNALEIAGLVSLAAGCFLIAIPVGLIVLGVSLVALGIATDRRITEGKK